ncbi:MAG: hypothetical protein A2014_00280 [Spirochaetes bacterium GWF1_49_6]|nr:MAG: hypothetical protein A2014_00280 [Spirochaetes bacterium GWF1_49_6]
MPRRRKAFTLIEMLVTLTVFSLSMITIVNLLTTSIKIMDRITGGDNSKTSAVILTKLLDNTFKNSYNIKNTTNQIYLIDTFDDKTMQLVLKEKSVLFADYKDGKLLNTRLFKIDSATSILGEVVETGGRKGFRLTIEFAYGKISRLFVLGYKKK